MPVTLIAVGESGGLDEPALAVHSPDQAEAREQRESLPGRAPGHLVLAGQHGLRGYEVSRRELTSGYGPLQVRRDTPVSGQYCWRPIRREHDTPPPGHRADPPPL